MIDESVLQKIAEYWKVTPEILWPGVILAVEETEASREYGAEEFEQLMSGYHQLQLLPPDQLLEVKELAERTQEVMSELLPREEKILRMRFGVGVHEEHTLEEVGQDLEVTGERIRMIEARALRKLRHPSCSRKLKTFVTP